MNTFLHHFAAIVTILVLALPPGSCGVFVQHGRTEFAPVKASCCHTTVPNRSCEPVNSPAKPNVQCCCVRVAALPEKSVQPTETHGLPVATVADHRDWRVSDLLSGHAAVIPAHSGPRLQILLCVWRC